MINNEENNVEETTLDQAFEEMESSEEVAKDETVTNEEVIEGTTEEMFNEELEEGIYKVTEGNLFQKIVAAVLDQALILGASALLVVATDLILKIFGFQIVENEPFIIIYLFIVNCIYGPLFSHFQSRTIGKRILNIL